MSLDLNKPLRIKSTKETVAFVLKLRTKDELDIVTLRVSEDRGEYIYLFRGYELENIPQSRWLNVYVGDSIVMPQWHESRESADRVAIYKVVRVAVIEDKQDGSDWIVHKLEQK